MNRGHLYKLLLIVFIIAWSMYSVYPPEGRDLVQVFKEKSGKPDATYTNILTELKKLEAANPGRSYGNLYTAIGTNDITRYFDYDVKGEKDTKSYILNRLQREASGKIKLGLDLIGGSAFLVEMQTNKLTEASKDVALDNAVEVLRKRVDSFGVAEPLIQKISGQNRILIQMPGLSQDVTERVREAIQKAAFLEFRMVHEDSSKLLEQNIIPPGYEVKKEAITSPTGEKRLVPVLLEKKSVPGLNGKNVRASYVTRDKMNRPEIAFQFDSQGAKVFGDLTSTNIGRQMAILLDGELQSAPVIQSAILEGNGVITGTFEEKAAFDLANVLQNPLEAPVRIVSENTVDPSLGKDAIESGVRASWVGTLAVSAFMALYYLLCGMVANVALIINIIVLLGVMCSIGTTLTLPGIAGVVLTVGMAVDANVLIFERIREESAKGKSLRGALQAGYARAFGTILDSHVTTLISSVILIKFGTGTIRGFGVALTIGVAASLFTALVVTRLIFDFMLSRNWIRKFSMFHLIPATLNINFMRYAKVAFIGTWTFIILSCGYGFLVRGDKALGIDFKGGDNLTLRFEDKVKDQEKIREALSKAGIKDPQIQYQKEMTGSGETLRITTAYGTGTNTLQTLQKAFPASKFSLASIENVGPTIGKEIQKAAIIASLLSMFGILIYVAFRYEFSFAVGAVLAIVHDIFLVIGAYFLSNGFQGREFNSTTVAAILTMIGFSTNDTIVIFDRIREDLRLGVKGTFRELINQALNQTLSRTIITSGTVFLATLSLFVFGGGAINDFAFTFLVGIITGTYSSIYIASALVLWWHKGERPAIGASVVVDSAGAPAPSRA
jgi:SecD/SecF fusion protein